MVDYTTSKQYENKAMYPIECSETSELFRRTEPLITPELLVSRYLKGIKLDFSSDELKDFINRAANDFELESGLTVERVQYVERQPFDKSLYASYVYTKVNHKPITSLERFAVVSSNGQSIFELPADWEEMGFAHRGQINVLPILTIFGATNFADQKTSNAGIMFLRCITNFTWLPAFFTVTYTAGLSKADGTVPIQVNEVIGMIAAIDILSGLQARITSSGSSIGNDSISQSTSSKGGGDIYATRILELSTKKDKIMGNLLKTFTRRIFMTNI